ncbi:MAG TPA: carbamoyltransferase HypF, partial [Rhodoferax sp.]|nr:carbamoyltransferase HypF [Rhodoferax sp.]
VIILACGSVAALGAFVDDLPAQAPPLACIEAIERESIANRAQESGFRIVASQVGHVHTNITPDAATCPGCLAEIFDPLDRRYRYPFTNCTHCGPRLSIIEAIPYDRGATTMRSFALCAQCANEYADPGNRRFHAQPVACPSCGPHTWLEKAGGGRFDPQSLNAVDDAEAAGTLIKRGFIVAIKGLGGFQLACDAGNEDAVSRLRQLKHRSSRKPLALMARDLAMVRRYCAISQVEADLLQGPASPIVILDATETQQLAASVAPGVTSLGFMLPNTPLHHLVMQCMERPMVLTSGNVADEPQCTENADALARLSDMVDYFLLHDRGVARRVDDSLVRVVAGLPRLMRRARGYAPAPIALPQGFDDAPAVLAMGGDLNNSFCLLRQGQAIMSHHMGDLTGARCRVDYLQSIESYLQLFEHRPQIVAVDQQPEGLSSKRGRDWGERRGLACEEVQHHHAHIAACLAENGIPRCASPVLGVVLDGLDLDADGSSGGGRFFLADYCQCRALGTVHAGVKSGVGGGRQTMANDDEPMVDALVGETTTRFQKNLTRVIGRMLDDFSGNANRQEPVKTVALSGKLFQSRILLEAVMMQLESVGFRVLTHHQVPFHDGGLALGQAVVAAARSLALQKN